ncbi:MAG: ATP-binding cassette domain-containing protein [Turicibacter sp.]
MSDIICQTINLSKTYKHQPVLNQVNFKVHRGDIYGLIGENGAGKTTLLRILTGLAFPTSGGLELFGETDSHLLSKHRAKIGCALETSALYLDMTATQNLEVQRIQMGIPGKQCIKDSLSLVKLDQTGKKKVKDFSLGMKQRLCLAMALLGEPEFLILDEPLNGLDPTGMIELRHLLIKLNKEKGMTIIISSHMLSELHKLATCYGIIHEGMLIEQISANQLDKQCKKHIFLVVEDTAKTVTILEHHLNISDYDICANHAIKIYDYIADCANITKALATQGIYVKEITIKGDRLESYFSKVIGGEQHV